MEKDQLEGAVIKSASRDYGGEYYRLGENCYGEITIQLVDGSLATLVAETHENADDCGSMATHIEMKKE
jgi:hypothetical protein